MRDWRALLVAAMILVGGGMTGDHAWAGEAMTPGQVFRDCPESDGCPEMVVVPPGRFIMGSSDEETSREEMPNQFAVWEKPQHPVTIAKAFAVGKFSVTYKEFNQFVSETGHKAKGCWGWNAKKNKPEFYADKSWQDPGFPQTDLRVPVVCVSWEDAHAYIDWLSRKSGKTYRLLSEAEWEYAARAGTTTARYWGEAIGNNNANCDGCGSRWDNQRTAPSGSFAANAFGLHDMLGNAWQWTEDCWTENHLDAPADGTARTTSNCSIRVYRGGSWKSSPWFLRAANRNRSTSTYPNTFLGFRLARTLL